jgi:uncharacterized protein (DUF1501 family)
MHRVAVIGAATLDSLPHNGAVVTLLAVCGATHRKSYLDIVMVAIVGALLALAVVIALGSTSRFVLAVRVRTPALARPAKVSLARREAATLKAPDSRPRLLGRTPWRRPSS